MIIHVKNLEEFKELTTNNDCFVDFFAQWCGPCKMLTPVIEELDEAGKFGNLKILKIDVDECQDIAKEFQIKAIPLLLLFRNGKQVNSHLGYLNDKEILDFIK